MRNFIFALSTLLGTIIGVGIFGLPYTTGQTGLFIIILYFIALSIIIYLINLIYGEIAHVTHNNHRLAGYVDLALGNKAKHFTFVVSLISFAITLLAYLIVGGNFLFHLLSPTFGGAELWYVLIFFLAGSILIFIDAKAIASIETVMLFVLILMIGILFVAGLPHISVSNLTTVNTGNGLLPYGIVMFSLWGVNIVPEILAMLKNNSKTLKSVIGLAIFISTACYLIFIISVLGVAGSNTTTDAISGLAPYLSNRILNFGYVFGILTTFTSFIALGLAMKNGFIYDYQLSKNTSSFLSCVLPLIFFFFGFKNFLHLMEIVGGVFLGIQGILIFLVYKKLKERKKISPKKSLIYLSNGALYFLMIIFIVGISMQLFYTLTS